MILRAAGCYLFFSSLFLSLSYSGGGGGGAPLDSIPAVETNGDDYYEVQGVGVGVGGGRG